MHDVRQCDIVVGVYLYLRRALVQLMDCLCFEEPLGCCLTHACEFGQCPTPQCEPVSCVVDCCEFVHSRPASYLSQRSTAYPIWPSAQPTQSKATGADYTHIAVRTAGSMRRKWKGCV